MGFNSLTFLIFFLPIFLAVFFLTPKKYRRLIILIGSILFYFNSGLFNGILIILISFANYLLSIFITKDSKYKNILFFLTIILNISILCFFKYNGSLLLPLGISFYIFNNISYIVDVKIKKILPEKNLLNYLTYSMLFCHVTMGPITSYESINNNLNNLNPELNNIYSGFMRFLNGLIKKVLIADNLGLLYNAIMNSAHPSSPLYLLGLITFALQLYLDFSSYSDMAIGLGKMLGINYPENFDHPYLAESITDFWRRWHITLSNFFKQYVYFPMGGSKVSKWRHVFNLLVVWLLTGMWHGNTLNFLIWGLYYFIIITIEKYFLLERMKKLPSFFRHLYVIVILLFGYIFFSIKDFDDIINFIKILFSFDISNTNFIFYLKENLILLLAAILLCLRIPNKLTKLLENNKVFSIINIIIHILLFILVIAYIVSGSYSPFLYNSF